MKNLNNFEEIGRAIGMKFDPDTNEHLLIFKIDTEQHKQFIRENWSNGLKFKLVLLEE